MKFLLLAFSLLFFSILWGGELNLQIVQEPAGIYPTDQLVIRLQGETQKRLPVIRRSDVTLKIGEEKIDDFSIEPYIHSGKPVDILFCVDISGSMNKNPIGEVKQAIKDFTKRLKPPIRIGLCAFGNEFYLFQPFTTDYELIRNKVQKLTAKENLTELYYGIYKAINVFDQYKSPPLRFLILFSDGKNDGSLAYTLDDCIEEAINKQVKVFSVGYTRVNPIYLKNLEKISDFTAGAYQHPRKRQDILKAYQQIKNNIMAFYVVQYNLKAEPGGLNGPLAIEIHTANDTLRTISERVIATPERFSTWSMVAILLIVLSSMGLTIGIYLRKKQDVEAVEREAREKENWYERELKKFRKNLDYVGQLLNSKEREKESAEADKLNRTLVLEKGLPTVCVLRGKNDDPIVIENYPIKIGKSPSCQIKINNPKVSREHALIDYQDGQIVITDLGSTNGVWLNGKKVKQATLNDGDVLSFGPVGYQVELIRY
ncbi:FHA domain-containing protein [Calditrichota bacterium GD2]